MEISSFISDLVLASAFRMLFFNGTTTTKEIKEEVRLRHPGLNITQDLVSDLMIVFEGMNFFEYTDNGTYRNYTLNVSHFIESYSMSDETNEVGETLVTKLEAISLINDLKEDDYFEVSFIKKDDSLRSMNCIVKNPNAGLGYLLVYEVLDDTKMYYDNNNIRTVDLRRIVSFNINDVNYKVAT